MNIFLLHTVRPGLDTFEARLLERYPGHKIYNYLNDYWNRKVLTEKAGFSQQSLRYLLESCTAMEQAGADMILCTCNSLSPHLRRVEEYLKVPVVLIDEGVPQAVLRRGQRILILATATSSAAAAVSGLETEAKLQGWDCSLHTLCLEEAGVIMREGGDMAIHDQIIRQAAAQIDPQYYDAVFLTQLSTAHLKEAIVKTTGLPVITTPDICLERLFRRFKNEQAM